MKKTWFLILLTVSCASLYAQEDVVVMRVNGQPVTRSEFEYFYNKNNSESVIDKKSVEEYAQLYADYKLKVLAAKDAQLDTLSSFQKEFRSYRDQQIRPLLIPAGAVDSRCRSYYDRILESLQGKELLQTAHIFMRLPQNASQQEQDELKVRMDSVYAVLQTGADFAELAKQLSQDTQTAARGGVLPWIGPNQTLKEFEDVAYSLEVGQYSQPFLSPVGYHIVKLMAKKPLESYEELKPNIKRYLESQGLENQLSSSVLDSLVQESGSQKTVEQILDEQTERLCAQDLNLKYLVQEYYEGLLLFEECSREVWEPAKADTAGIQKYFKSNKKKYSWSEPHYRGMVYYCQNEKDVKAVKKALKKVDISKWTTLKLTVEKYIKYCRDNEISEAWVKQLERASVRAHISRLEAIQLQIIHEMNKLSYMTENKLTDVIEDVYKGSYYNTGYEIAIGTGIGISFSKINTKQLETIMKTPWAVDGKTFSQRIWGNNDKVIEELKQVLTRSIIQGTAPSKTIQSIQKIFKTSQSNAERLVMTESSFFASKATHDSYKSTGVERYQILATLDHRTSEICRDMDGKVFRMSDYEPGVSAPPFHARCRTTTIPYFDDNYGKRIAKDNNGKTIYVDSKMTYRDWEKKFVK